MIFILEWFAFFNRGREDSTIKAIKAMSKVGEMEKTLYPGNKIYEETSGQKHPATSKCDKK